LDFGTTLTSELPALASGTGPWLLVLERVQLAAPVLPLLAARSLLLQQQKRQIPQPLRQLVMLAELDLFACGLLGGVLHAFVVLLTRISGS
jgi:hypothetical protein